MEKTKKAKRIVIKVGSSTLTYQNGKLNLRRIEKLCCVLSDLKNSGRQIVLVSSGAVSAGMGKLNMDHKPKTVEEKQAMASVGQGELMRIYEGFFAAYGSNIGQILLTRDIINNETGRKNAENTFEKLLEMNIIPIVNENDTVAFDEIKFGDNDTLSAYVALLCKADLLINMSDMDGFYDKDPRKNPDAKLIEKIKKVDAKLYDCASGAGTNVGTGGMVSKLHAAEIACPNGIAMMIVSGEKPEILYDILEDGKKYGTFFCTYKN